MAIDTTLHSDDKRMYRTSTEKDSPHYGAPSFCLQNNIVHQMYVNGEVQILTSYGQRKWAEEMDVINSEMRVFRRELMRKMFDSERHARDIVLTD